jgi:hypothetical protein
MIRLALILFCLPLLSLAQVYDDFSDGDFTHDPPWSGTVPKFKVNDNFQLQLYDTAAGKAYLVTPNTMADACEWRFWIRQSFSPSSNNNGRVYLVSDREDLTDTVHGYFVQLGESGSNDAVELFRQDGASVTSVCRGTDGMISSSFAIGFKITRDENGNWNIWVDKENNGIYLPEASGEDNTYRQTQYFGFLAKYTVSNATKFYWDDVYAGEMIIDNQPPVVEYVLAVSDSSLLLKFDEPPEETSALNKANYVVNNNIGNPDSINAEGLNVSLFFDKKFQNGVTYQLTVSNISDLSGNVMEPYQTEFSFYTAKEFDVVFNEIFPDPNPSVGLPGYEFLELYNRTENNISLKGWTLTIGSSEKSFENVVIPKNGYLIVGKDDAAGDYAPYGLFYGFGTFSLVNSGQTLMLKDQHGDLIAEVRYDDTWYRDPDKEDGGWSMEEINPDNLCSGSANWRASVNPAGGTPGTQNSVYEDILLKPSLQSFELMSEDVISLIFDQKMDKESLSDPQNYFVNNGVGNPSGAYPDINDPARVGLVFAGAFENGVNYALTIKKSLKNCMGLEMEQDTTVMFGNPEEIGPGDIVINEILFDPLTGGEDYVELYNRSDKFLDVSQLKIGSVKISPPNPPDTVLYAISADQHLVLAGAYLVLTRSPEAVKAQYFTSDPDAFLKADPFPSYNNDQGTVLITTDSAVIDAFTYNVDMQYPLLNYVEGVALERIDPDGMTNDRNNWHSAAENVGFGTPGYKNSQFSSPQNNRDEITVEPEVFSPDNDGKDDVLGIGYHFAEPGNSLSIDIFDKSGRRIKRLIDNEYVGTSGTVFWDGTTDDHTKALVGIYIIYIKTFDTNGKVETWKKSAVVAAKW